MSQDGKADPLPVRFSEEQSLPGACSSVGGLVGAKAKRCLTVPQEPCVRTGKDKQNPIK